MHGYGHMEILFIAELHHPRHLQHHQYPPKQHLSHLNAQTLLIAGPKLVCQTNQQYATIQTLHQKQAANTYIKQTYIFWAKVSYNQNILKNEYNVYISMHDIT